MKRNEEPTPEAQAEYERIGEEMASVGVARGKMFTSQALLLNGKAIACLMGSSMAFKLGRENLELERALSLDGAVLFDPSGMGRPFKDWAEVPQSGMEEWAGLAEAALAAKLAE
ncbi:hypothetical protein [Neomicrococcus aestuarii]|uniref:TfoX N-terminal domain-containing protein n=1 Tax=Neomicrococcus aestuarii TaxID=556325 RepID=A0A1L2ZN14_9MICC|nr:hypothetical protein [Neomicrococcus aestuarii]APF40793.1 hypothetical protein BHE16_06970 [Neomicrococcus aestuarii]